MFLGLNNGLDPKAEPVAEFGDVQFASIQIPPLDLILTSTGSAPLGQLM